jgi:5-formyltetrahydrofolate cyclo-ligase
VLVTTVHPLQVVREPFPETVHDFRVDLIVTPDKVIWCGEPHRPPGILWEHLRQDKIAEVPALTALAAERGSGQVFDEVCSELGELA